MNGKGDKRRKRQVSEAEFAKRWEIAFSKEPMTYVIDKRYTFISKTAIERITGKR